MLRTLQMNCKRALLIAACIAFFLYSTACGNTSLKTDRDYRAEAEAASVYCVMKNECFLCGNPTKLDHSDLSGQNNVGIISLNTFELLPIEINRYDHGQLIEENTGVIRIHSFQPNDDSCSAYSMLDADRGIANVTISPNGNLDLDLINVASYLCADCLKDFAAQLRGDAYSIGVFHFSTNELYALQQNIAGFGVGDYHTHVDNDLPEGDIHLLITYSPLRYQNPQQ